MQSSSNGFILLVYGMLSSNPLRLRINCTKHLLIILFLQRFSNFKCEKFRSAGHITPLVQTKKVMHFTMVQKEKNDMVAVEQKNGTNSHHFYAIFFLTKFSMKNQIHNVIYWMIQNT